MTPNFGRIIHMVLFCNTTYLTGMIYQMFSIVFKRVSSRNNSNMICRILVILKLEDHCDIQKVQSSYG